MDSLKLNSRGYFLWNNSLGLAMGGMEADEPVEVASLTKIMTALVTLENKDLAEMVAITPEMLQGLEEFAIIGLQVGQVVTIEDLLYATMLPSAGDAAQALAIGVAGSIEGFAGMMNERAAEIGMTKTQFSNPVGKDTEAGAENYSTPADIVKLLKVALENPKFLEIFTTFTKELPTLERTVYKTFSPSKYIWGGKTGFTYAAGRCLASVAEIEGTEYILVTVGAENGQHVADAEKVYRMVEANYEPVKLLSEGEKILRIQVQSSPTKAMEFTAEREVTVALENDTTIEELTYEYEGVQEITPKLKLGTKLGDFRINQGENQLYVQEIYYNEALEFYHYGWIGFGVGISVGLLIVTILLARKKRRVKGVTKRRKLMLAGAALLFLVSLVVNFRIFVPWFEDGLPTEVYRPAITGGQDEDGGDDGETNDGGQDDEPSEVLGNCTVRNENLMLINPNFTVGQDFITARRGELISVSNTYGIQEYRPGGNGDNLLMPEAAAKLSEMVKAYEEAYPGHTIGTVSCFRERGTQCGRLCAATGASDHHTGLTCDLIDREYGLTLTTDDYAQHLEWQWLKENSYKYGFIDRFPEAWAGGSMDEPLNVDENGSTGLFETWHYRYVGVKAATEIATGKYNNGEYDSLEHYLKATGRVRDLKNGEC